MNTIIAAAIAILVLLVVIMIFTSNMKKPAGEIKGVNEDRQNILTDIGGEITECDICYPKASDCTKGIDSFKKCSNGGYCCAT